MNFKFNFNTKAIVVTLIVVFVCGAFIFTGFGKIHLYSGLDPNTIATVGNQKITVQEFRHALQNQKMMTRGLNEEQERAFEKQILNHLIKEKIVVDAIRNLGWEAQEQDIAVWVKQLPEFKDPESGQFDIKLYKKFLSHGGMSELGLFSIAKDMISKQKFHALANLPVAYPDSYLTDLYRRDQVEFSIEVALLQVPTLVFEETLKKAVQAYLADESHITALKAVYEQSTEFKGEQLYDFETILIGYQGAQRSISKQSKESALSLAEKSLEQIKNGSKIASLTSINDDVRAKPTKGLLINQKLTDLDPSSSGALLSLTLEQPLFNEPIDTPFGYRILKLKRVHSLESKSFEEAKAILAKRMIENQIRTQLTTELVTKASAMLKDNTYQKLNLRFERIDQAIKLSTPFIPKLGSTKELNQVIFQLKKPGETVLTYFEQKPAIVRLRNIKFPTAPSKEQLETLAMRKSMFFAYEFSALFEQEKLTEMKNKGKIEINSMFKNLN